MLDLVPDTELSSTVTPPSRFPALKWLGIGIAGLLGVLVVLVLLGPLVMPETLARSFVGSIGRVIVGQPIKFVGPIDFALVPSVRVDGRDVVIGDQESAGDVLTIKRLDVTLGTLSLITGALAIERLLIEEPVLRRRVDAMLSDNKLVRRAWGQWRGLELGEIMLSNGRIEDESPGGSVVTVSGISMKKNPLPPSGRAGLRFDGEATGRNIKWRLRADLGSATDLITGAGSKTTLTATGDGLTASLIGRAAWRHGFVASGALTVFAGNLSGLETFAGLPTNSLGPGVVRIDGKLTIDAGRRALEDVTIELGRTTATGRISFAERTEGREIDGAFDAQSLDLKPLGLLATTVMDDTADLGRVAAGYPSRGGVRIAWERVFAGNVEGKAGVIRIDRAKAGAPVRLEFERAEIGGGTLRGDVSLGHGEGMTALTAAVRMRGVDIGKLGGAMGMPVPITGEGLAELELLSVGADNAQLLAALRGNGMFTVDAGELRNANLVEALRQDLGRGDAKALAFSRFAGSFNVSRGILISNHLLMQSNGWSIIGNGKLDLANDSMTGRLATLVDEAAGGRRKSDFALTGTLSAPDIKVAE